VIHVIAAHGTVRLCDFKRPDGRPGYR
jgi:hypothetical protein